MTVSAAKYVKKFQSLDPRDPKEAPERARADPREVKEATVAISSSNAMSYVKATAMAAQVPVHPSTTTPFLIQAMKINATTRLRTLIIKTAIAIANAASMVMTEFPSKKALKLLWNLVLDQKEARAKEARAKERAKDTVAA
jgi:hypothetical protein